jgi:uncharacterized UPF0160 family protein
MAARDSIRIAVHSGTYHADDVFALAITVLWAQGRNYDCTMVRTRDMKDIAGCQVVLDVGGEYDPVRHRFDHHQPEFTEVRSNGIGYASAGLAWKNYGPELCGDDAMILKIVDDTLIAGIDAHDVAATLIQSSHPSGVMPPSLGYLTALSQPTWQEQMTDPEKSMNEAFWLMYAQAKNIVQRAILHARSHVEAERMVVQAYENAVDKRIVIADFEYPAWIETLSRFPEPLFFVYRRLDQSWGAKGVRVDGWKSFAIRREFPSQWAGMKDSELREITGVADALFAHRGRFYVTAQSKEGVLALISKTLLIE